MQQAFQHFGVSPYEMRYINKYAPLIDSDLMLQLCHIKRETGESIVKLVNKAVKQFVKTT